MAGYLKAAIIILCVVFIVVSAILIHVIYLRDDSEAPPRVSPATEVGRNITRIASELLPPEQAQEQMKQHIEQHGSVLKGTKRSSEPSDR